MEGKRTKGRQKIPMKKIENEDDRLITFSKRRAGIYKKASELVTLCGAEVGIIVYSPAGKCYSFSHPSMDAITDRFVNGNPQLSDSANTHPLVEAHRRIRIRELNEKHNDLVSQLDAEKERGKMLKQMSQPNRVQGWWELPIDELSLEELEKIDSSAEEFQNNLLNHINGVTVTNNEASCSSFPATLNPNQPTNPFHGQDYGH
ncbi:hypothetical protein ACOSP7_011606 [Xanthoceras sorbifolium]